MKVPGVVRCRPHSKSPSTPHRSPPRRTPAAGLNSSVCCRLPSGRDPGLRAAPAPQASAPGRRARPPGRPRHAAHPDAQREGRRPRALALGLTLRPRRRGRPARGPSPSPRVVPTRGSPGRPPRRPGAQPRRRPRGTRAASSGPRSAVSIARARWARLAAATASPSASSTVASACGLPASSRWSGAEGSRADHQLNEVGGNSRVVGAEDSRRTAATPAHWPCIARDHGSDRAKVPEV